MLRRDLLDWASRFFQLLSASIVGLPGLKYIYDGLAPVRLVDARFSRAILLKNLPPGQARQVAVMGRVQDGWVAEEGPVGRVWLLRNGDEVKAYSNICPHMGCQIQGKGSNEFFCPCHKASFGADGSRQGGHANPAPRNMDQLECRIAEDELTGETWIEVQYEKFETGSTQKKPVA